MNVFEFNISLDVVDAKSLLGAIIVQFHGINLRFWFNNAEDSLGSSHGFTHIWTKSSSCSSLRGTEHNCHKGNHDIIHLNFFISFHNCSSSIKHSSKDKILTELCDSESEPNLDVLELCLDVPWLKETLEFLDNKLSVSKWLDGSKVDNWISA